MSAQAKFLVGLLAVGLLTWAWLQPFGQARMIADDIENRVTQTLAARGHDTVSVTVPRSPVHRTVALQGDVPNGERAELLAAVQALDGVSSASWIQADAAEAAEVATAATTAAEICRDALNTVFASHRIQFRSGSPYLNAESRRLLDRIAEAAQGCRGIRIEIAGHGSSGGRENVNLEMSAFRATTVRDALVERGVAADMLTTIGKGSSEPLGDNPADPANRRIEFTVSVTDGKAS